MDVVVVPLVPQEAAIGPLLDLLERRERSGLVVHHYQPDGSERYRLVYAGPLLEARRANVPMAGDVPSGHEVRVVDDHIARSFGLDLVRPGRTWQQYETMLDSHGVLYGLIGETSDAAMLVTRHEAETETLMGAVYTCNGPNWHGFPEPRVSIGDSCPLRPECGRPDSTIKAYP